MRIASINRRNSKSLLFFGALCALALVLACTACSGGSSNAGSTQDGGTAAQTTGNTTTQTTASTTEATAVKQNPSHLDATSGTVELSGTIVREERTTKDTMTAWSAVVYWLVFDNSMTITHKDFMGNTVTNTFSRITVGQLEQYDSDADRNLASITDPYWQPYVGQKVTVQGEVFDTGNAHTFGYALMRNTRVMP